MLATFKIRLPFKIFLTRVAKYAVMSSLTQSNGRNISATNPFHFTPLDQYCTNHTIIYSKKEEKLGHPAAE